MGAILFVENRAELCFGKEDMAVFCPFVNQYPAGEGLLRAYLQESVARDLSWGCLILGALGGVLSRLLAGGGLWLESGLCMGLALLSLAAAVGAKILPRWRGKRANTRPERVGVVEFGPRIRVTEGAEVLWADYTQIVRIRRLTTFSVLLLDSGEAIVVANDGFIRGEPDQFWPFLEEMMARHGADLNQNTPEYGGREQI